MNHESGNGHKTYGLNIGSSSILLIFVVLPLHFALCAENLYHLPARIPKGCCTRASIQAGAAQIHQALPSLSTGEQL